MSGTEPEWAPRRRIRHLHSIQIHNFDGQAQKEPSRAYFALWSHVKASNAQHEAECLYVSEQVELGHGSEWLPIDWSASRVPSRQLHGLFSGSVHVHIYAVQSEEEQGRFGLLTGPLHPSQETLARRSRLPAASPLHAEGPVSCTIGEVGVSSDEEQELEGSADILANEPDSAHLVGFQQQPPSASRSHGTEYTLCKPRKWTSPLLTAGQGEDMSLCEEVPLPGDLLLAASLDLESLACIGRDRTGLDRLHSGPTVIAELTDGSLCVWPGLPEDWAPQDALDTDSSPRVSASASSSAPNQAEGRAGVWGGLFRRATLGSTPDFLARDHAELSEVFRPSHSRSSSMHAVTSSPQTALRATISSAEEEKLPPRQQEEVSWEGLENGMLHLAALQLQRSGAQARASSALNKLNKALEARQTRWGQHRRLADAHALAEAARQRYRRCSQRAARLNASANAARELVQGQCTHLCSALARLEAFWDRLEDADVPDRRRLSTEWRALHRKLVARRCRLASDLRLVFGINPRTVPVIEAPESGFLWHQLDHGWATVSVAAPQQPWTSASQSVAVGAGSMAASLEGGDSESVSRDSESSAAQTRSELSVAGSQIRSVVRICISTLALEPTLGRQKSEPLPALGWESETEERLKAAAALGYAVHVTQALATYLNVPLKYPLKPANSRSAVLECPHPVCLLSKGPGREDGDAAGPGMERDSASEFSLYAEGTDPTRFAYSIFMLNKDVEQLLDVHGLTSVGPSHVLQNLYKLLSAAGSAVSQRPEEG